MLIKSKYEWFDTSIKQSICCHTPFSAIMFGVGEWNLAINQQEKEKSSVFSFLCELNFMFRKRIPNPDRQHINVSFHILGFPTAAHNMDIMLISSLPYNTMAFLGNYLNWAWSMNSQKLIWQLICKKGLKSCDSIANLHDYTILKAFLGFAEYFLMLVGT